MKYGISYKGVPCQSSVSSLNITGSHRNIRVLGILNKKLIKESFQAFGICLNQNCYFRADKVKSVPCAVLQQHVLLEKVPLR